MKRRKSFEQRVIDYLRHEGWNIQYNAPDPIDFFAVRPHTHVRNAYRVKAHRHLSHAEQEALHDYYLKTKVHVLYVHEIADRELEFRLLYPRAICHSS